ncbi:hypothetical protein LIER_19109 [Lithospermum erythrorhizon]|uniref:Uncharacterized protein n=1 Tax=Lithospermum erythrorhizon TaxID=34254 RepID=A0AAV3QHQ6_LITER
MGKTSNPSKKRGRNQNPQTSNQLAIVELGSSSDPRPSVNRNILPASSGKSGRAGKLNILDGYYYDGTDLEGSHFWDLVKIQKWEKFLGKSYAIFQDWIYFFYEHVVISIPNELTFKLGYNGRTLQYKI